ncbi:hypothetical protein ACOMHN_006667 [Nucella lapillus]
MNLNSAKDSAKATQVTSHDKNAMVYAERWKTSSQGEKERGNKGTAMVVVNSIAMAVAVLTPLATCLACNQKVRDALSRFFPLQPGNSEKEKPAEEDKKDESVEPVSIKSWLKNVQETPSEGDNEDNAVLIDSLSIDSDEGVKDLIIHHEMVK